MENAKEVTDALNQRAEEAQKIADALVGPKQQDVIAEASERGIKLAQEASKEDRNFKSRLLNLPMPSTN